MPVKRASKLIWIGMVDVLVKLFRIPDVKSRATECLGTNFGASFTGVNSLLDGPFSFLPSRAAACPVLKFLGNCQIANTYFMRMQLKKQVFNLIVTNSNFVSIEFIHVLSM